MRKPQKMAKSKRKKTRGAISAKKTKKGQTKAVEYVSNLLELHKLQGALLTKLKKEV